MNNSAKNEGGSIVVEGNSTTEFQSIVIESSTALSAGGVLVSGGSLPIFTDMTISDCYSFTSGGALVVAGHCNPSFIGCNFYRNGAFSEGGAIVCKDFSFPIFTEIQIL